MTAPSRPRRWPWLVVIAAALALLLFFLLSRAQPGQESAQETGEARSASPSARAPGRAEPPSAPAPAEPSPEPRPSLAPFTGRVVSAEDGRPVVGAEVTFLAPEGATSVRSGPDGRFRLVPSRPGPHQLAAVQADGYVPFGPEWGQSPIRLVAPAPAGTPELLLSLDPEVRLSGRVEAAAGGTPLPGAMVTLRSSGAQSALLGTERSWVTDAQGTFSGTAPPDAVVVARAPGFAPAAEPLRGAGRTRSIVLRLNRQPEDAPPDRPLAGRVVSRAERRSRTRW